MKKELLTELNYYFIYQTTNLINSKFYIGKRKTKKLDDGYLGSGRLLQRAIKKYGRENFKREIVCFCNNQKELNEMEAYFINSEFLEINKNICYNIALGGQGGDTISNNLNKIEIYQKKKEGNIPAWNKGLTKETNEVVKKYSDRPHTEEQIKQGIETRRKNGTLSRSEHCRKLIANFRKTIIGELHPNYNKPRTENTKNLISIANSDRIWMKNLNLGIDVKVKKDRIEEFIDKDFIRGRIYKREKTWWISNDNLKKSIYIKEIKSDSYLKDGWVRGRKYE